MTQPQMQYPGMNASPCPIQPCVMVQSPGSNMGANGCPFTPCMMDQALMGQYGQPNADPYGRTAVNPPCQECGAVPNAPCIQMQGQGQGGGLGMGMGMGMNMGMGMGMGMPISGAMTPCMECGNIPNAPCVSQQGALTPCMECGNIPNAPCLPPQGGMFDQMAGGCPCSKELMSNTPCVECAGLPNAPCAAPPEPEGNYQEIGASMGGNSLTIRVHKDKNKVEQIDPNAPMISENSSEAGCCCAPGQVGKKKKKQDPTAFNMRPGVQQGNQDMPFSFKMGKSGNPGGNNVVVNPPIATAPDGTKFTEFSDPNKELFILRVGKKSEGMDKKQNLELELCTPRGKAL